jgi:hypothetical protein
MPWACGAALATVRDNRVPVSRPPFEPSSAIHEDTKVCALHAGSDTSTGDGEPKLPLVGARRGYILIPGPLAGPGVGRRWCRFFHARLEGERQAGKAKRAFLIRPNRRVVAVSLVASAAVLGTAVGQAAADTPPVPAGMACEFLLTVESGEDTRSVHEFIDADGNVVRLLLAGRGTAVRLTNEDTGATLSLPASGAP